MRASPRLFPSVALILFIVGLLIPPAMAADPRFQVKLAATVETGDFGTTTTTTTLFVPLTLRYLGDQFDLGVTIPYIFQRTSRAVSALEGIPILIRRGEEEVEGRRAEGIISSQGGIGDVVLKGRYYLVEDRGGLPAITPFAKVKVPTADRDKGLGTGEFDYGFGVEVDKRFGPLVLFGDLGYTIIGDPPGIALRDKYSYGGGLSFDLTRALTGSASIDGSTAVREGTDDPLDLFFQLDYRLGKITTLTAGFSLGLSDGSPDFGLTAGVSYKF